jgi:hypothetical protein
MKANVNILEVKQVMKANVNILEVKQVTYLALAG